MSYFDASRLWVLHSMSVEVSREPSFPEWEERMLRWPQGTVVASSWQGLRCQPCRQFHALGTRGKEEQLVFLTNSSVVPTLNNRTQTPLPRLLVQGAKIKDSKDTKDLKPHHKVLLRGPCCCLGSSRVGRPSSALPPEPQVFCSLRAYPGSSLTWQEMADGAGPNAGLMHTSGPNHTCIIAGKFVEVFVMWWRDLSCIKSMHLHVDPV